MYSFKSRVRYSEVGEDKKLSLNSIINYFQDCSTFQSEELNNGVERLEKLHRVWVLSSWQIVIERYPDLCEEIETGTVSYTHLRVRQIRPSEALCPGTLRYAET